MIFFLINNSNKENIGKGGGRIYTDLQVKEVYEKEQYIH